MPALCCDFEEDLQMFADVGIIRPTFSTAARKEAEHLMAVQNLFLFSLERDNQCAMTVSR